MSIDAAPTPLPPGKLRPADRALRALNLRRAGMSWDDIAAHPTVGYKGRSAAYTAVQRLLERQTTEGVTELRELENQRLDAMQLALWPKVLRGDPDAVNAALRVSQRRARMNGLDEPVEYRLRLETEQVEFLEATIRRVLAGVAGHLATHGGADLVHELWDTVEGEIVPREIAAAADLAAGDGDVA